MNTLLEKLDASPGTATEAQVEQLANTMYAAGTHVRRADSTYFRVLLAACQPKLAARRRGRPSALAAKSQMAVLNATHERFYAAVLRGVTTPDVAPVDGLAVAERQRRMLERNRRSGFARSAVSALRSFVEAGGDLRALDPLTTSKSAVRAAVAPPEPTDKAARQISRAEGALLRAVRRQAKASPSDAAAAIERVFVELRALLDDIGGDTEPEVTRRAARAAGLPVLNATV